MDGRCTIQILEMPACRATYTVRRENPRIVQYVDRRLFQLFVQKLSEMLKELPAPWDKRKRGRPGHEPIIVATMGIIYVAFGHTYNSLESEVCNREDVKKALGVEKLPGHSVVHRGMKRLSMKWIRNVITVIVEKIYKKGTIGGDASGISLHRRSGWYTLVLKSESPRKRRHFLKLHIIVCFETGVIANFRVTDGAAHDSPVFRRMLKELKFLLVFGDKGLAAKKTFDLIYEKGGISFIQPKRNARARARGSLSWRRFVKFARGMVFQVLKGLRSFVEGTISAIKRAYGDFVRAKKRVLQRRELALRILSYNIRRALHIEHAKAMNEPLWIYP